VEASNKLKPLKVVLDSNAFFLPLKFKIDIFEDVKRLLGRNVEFILLSTIKQELEILASGDQPKLRKEAIFALRLAEKCKFVVLEQTQQTTDEIILQTAQKWKSPVFTNDRLLKKRLRDISVPVIYLKQKSLLDIDGLIL
jgi:uncharacterized protein